MWFIVRHIKTDIWENKKWWGPDIEIILDRRGDTKGDESEFDARRICVHTKMYNFLKERLPTLSLSIYDKNMLIFDMTDRVVKVFMGKRGRSYRSKLLTRLNDDKFRKR